MQTYDAVWAHAVQLWQTKKDAAIVVHFVQSALSQEADQTLRGRLLCLLSKFTKRTGDLRAAEAANLEALSLLSDPEHRADALCNGVDLCVDTNRVEDGLRFAIELEELIRDVPTPAVLQWEAPFLHNRGRLLDLAGDLDTAVRYLRQSVECFCNTDRIPESHSVRAHIARSLAKMGELDEAETICRELRAENVTAFTLLSLDMVQALIAGMRGDCIEAERRLDKAAKSAVAVTGRQDSRVWLTLLLAEADLDEARGDVIGARRLRSLVKRWAASGKIDNFTWGQGEVLV